jgi:hypothetical protein
MSKNQKMVLLFLSFFCFNICLAQPSSDIKQVALNTQKSLLKLRSKIKSSETKKILSFTELDLATTKFYDMIEEDIRADIIFDTLLINSLKGLQKEIEDLAVNTKSEDFIQRVNFIKSDLTVKTNALPFSISSGINQNILVTVVTKKNDQHYGGYDVKCNAIWDFNLQTSKMPFTNPTNEATKNLAPGMYIIWIEKEGVHISNRIVQIPSKRSVEDTIIFNVTN